MSRYEDIRKGMGEGRKFRRSSAWNKRTALRYWLAWRSFCMASAGKDYYSLTHTL